MVILKKIILRDTQAMCEEMGTFACNMKQEWNSCSWRRSGRWIEDDLQNGQLNNSSLENEMRLKSANLDHIC